MTTARERYEQKTKVVTFRVSTELFNQIEEIKARSGLSNSDLIKLGAGIAREEIKAKLAESAELEQRLVKLQSTLDEEEQGLKKFIVEERRRRLEELDLEIKAFKLFHSGWDIEQVRFKLGLPDKTAFRYFQEWCEIRNDKDTLKSELIKACLKRHIDKLECSLSWARYFPFVYREQADELAKRTAEFRSMLAMPSSISKDVEEFLLAEYSDSVLSSDMPGKETE